MYWRYNSVHYSFYRHAIESIAQIRVLHWLAGEQLTGQLAPETCHPQAARPSSTPSQHNGLAISQHVTLPLVSWIMIWWHPRGDGAASYLPSDDAGDPWHSLSSCHRYVQPWSALWYQLLMTWPSIAPLFILLRPFHDHDHVDVVPPKTNMLIGFSIGIEIPCTKLATCL